MIEVLGIEEPKEEIEITPELALAAARVLKAFCEQHDRCAYCPLEEIGCNDDGLPERWEIPEREV